MRKAESAFAADGPSALRLPQRGYRGVLQQDKASFSGLPCLMGRFFFCRVIFGGLTSLAGQEFRFVARSIRFCGLVAKNDVLRISGRWRGGKGLPGHSVTWENVALPAGRQQRILLGAFKAVISDGLSCRTCDISEKIGGIPQKSGWAYDASVFLTTPGGADDEGQGGEGLAGFGCDEDDSGRRGSDGSWPTAGDGGRWGIDRLRATRGRWASDAAGDGEPAGLGRGRAMGNRRALVASGGETEAGCGVWRWAANDVSRRGCA